MTHSFADLRKDILQNVTTNSEYFGEEVTYKSGEDLTTRINVHCKHSQRFTFDDSGNEVVVEEVTVTIDRESLPREPKSGDLIYRGTDTIGYLYAYGGGDQPHYWRRVFERRRRLAQG
jgi:hypothetical protein